MERVIFSANADSMDSWDIENLKYLRKLSIRNPHSCRQDAETISYRSDTESFVNECEDLLDAAIYKPSKGNESEFVRKLVKTHHEFPQVKKISVHATLPKTKTFTRDENNNNEEIPITAIKTATMGKLDGGKSMRVAQKIQQQKLKPLDDCYVMDVLMVRNESVLTDHKSSIHSNFSKSPEEQPILIHKKETSNNRMDSLSRKEINLLRGCASSPSSVSSDDSFTSAIEKGFFDMDNNRCSAKNSDSKVVKENKAHVVESPRIPSSSMINYTRVERFNNFKSITEECPFCGGCGGVGVRSESFTTSKKPQLMRKVKTAPTPCSMAPTCGSIPPINIPKTPSPYYLRLTKDLLSTSNSSLSSSINKPNNFGLNPSGHLVIDYSSNWRNLESYVKSLSVSTENLSVRPSTKIPERLRTRYSY